MSENRAALTRQVKEASDIVTVVGAYLPLSPVGPVFKALCPFHQDSRPSLDVDPRRQRYRCWACGKFGDVFTFVMEFEKVDFIEARTILARRAGIALDAEAGPDPARIRMLETMRWATQRYQYCFLDDEKNVTVAEQARIYVGGRGLSGATLRAFGVGFAPSAGEWLVREARAARIPPENLLEVGLVAHRREGEGLYDRFRDRVMFPIRDVRGQTVAFGGRILPSSPLAERGPKYYNSTETPLFNKSEVLYGLDHARHAAATAGYLAVVEGYTDVLMAHQMGVGQVVATMGTALNAKHVQQLRRFVQRVVLVFDADEGGSTGVDRALEIFVGQDVELAIATLPDGLDPCDLLVQQGADAFRLALTTAIDALDFKLNQLLAKDAATSIEGTRRIVDSILGMLAMVPETTGQAGRVKQELIVTRIAQRMRLEQKTVWDRLKELRTEQRDDDDRRPRPAAKATPAAPKTAKAPMLELQLAEILLAEPGLVPDAVAKIPLEEITHAGLRKLIGGLYELHAAGEIPDLDAIRTRLDHPALVTKAMELQDRGLAMSDRPAAFGSVVKAFATRSAKNRSDGLRNQLTGATDEQALELLKRLQNRQTG